MIIIFACGCPPMKVSDDTNAPPICPCGERRIRDVKAPAPRFRGVCQGPSAVSVRLDPIVVDVAPAGPLKLKEPTDAE